MGVGAEKIVLDAGDVGHAGGGMSVITEMRTEPELCGNSRGATAPGPRQPAGRAG